MMYNKSRRIMRKTRKGAASFYIVTITTLILMVLVVSFATVIASEMERTTNDDLSQSAYDSALAGVEDAKIAYALYEKCKTVPGSEPNCDAIKNWVEKKSNECNMVAGILNKGDGEVMIEEVNSTKAGVSNNMQQYYTCAKLGTELPDYRATLSSSAQTKVVKATFANGVTADMIDKVRISWYSGESGTYTKDNTGKLTGNYINNRVRFPLIGAQRAATPPTISVALVQTATYFNYEEFDASRDGRTNRAMVYLVPTSGDGGGATGNYVSAWDGSQNIIRADQVAATNNKESQNLPYTVKCGGDKEFACSTLINLPEPIVSTVTGSTERNNDTFLIMVALPYGTPETDFSLEFICRNSSTACLSKSESEGMNGGQVKLSGVQVEIDSTGRANDIYRRVITRMESSADSSFLSIMGPLELYGSTNGTNEKAMEKNITVTTE